MKARIKRVDLGGTTTISSLAPGEDVSIVVSRWRETETGYVADELAVTIGHVRHVGVRSLEIEVLP